MSAVGSIPAAAACIAWARPISAPSAVTKEFSDMFCALNGATATPCRASHRHSPATSTLLPASDPVPATRSAPRGLTVPMGVVLPPVSPEKEVGHADSATGPAGHPDRCRGGVRAPRALVGGHRGADRVAARRLHPALLIGAVASAR